VVISYLADPFLTFAHRNSSHDVGGDFSTKVKVLFEKAIVRISNQVSKLTINRLYLP
jgi:hypothetical protein